MTTAGNLILRYWTRQWTISKVKRRFVFNGKRGDNIPVAGVGPRTGIKRHRLELSGHEIKEIFEPVISEILTLVEEEIQQTAKAKESQAYSSGRAAVVVARIFKAGSRRRLDRRSA